MGLYDHARNDIPVGSSPFAYTKNPAACNQTNGDRSDRRHIGRFCIQYNLSVRLHNASDAVLILQSFFEIPADTAEKTAVLVRRIVNFTGALRDIARKNTESFLRGSRSLTEKDAVVLRNDPDQRRFEDVRDLPRRKRFAVDDHIPARHIDGEFHAFEKTFYK